MEDSKRILKNGHGTPYLAVFNSRGKPIIDHKNKLPIGMNISSWFYQYDEEKEDTAEFVIETDNPDLVDHPDLREHAGLRLQWGYIYDDGTSISGPIRTVIIKDTEPDFGENGTKLTVNCMDSFGLTKTTPANMEDKAFLVWLKNNVMGKFVTEIIDHTTDSQIYIKKKEE